MTHHPNELCMVDHGGRPCSCPGFNGNPIEEGDRNHDRRKEDEMTTTGELGIQYHKSDYKFDKTVIGEGHFRATDEYAKTLSTPPDWEKAFDRDYAPIIKSYYVPLPNGTSSAGSEDITQSVKSFIRQTIQQEVLSRDKAWTTALDNIVDNHAGKTPEQAITAVISTLTNPTPPMNNLREKIEDVIRAARTVVVIREAGNYNFQFGEDEVKKATDRLLTLFAEERARVRGLVEYDLSTVDDYEGKKMVYRDAVLSLLSEPNQTPHE